MAITKNIITGSDVGTRAGQLATFLTNSGFVTAANDSGTVNCYDDDENLLISIELPSVNVYYKDCIEPLPISLGNTSMTNARMVYICTNGVMITIHTNETNWNTGYSAYIFITKNNSDETTFVVSYTADNLSVSGRSCVKAFFPVAWTDDGLVAHPSFSIWNPVSFNIVGSDGYWNQSALVPFPTYAKPGVISYTPNAGFFLISPSYTVGEGVIQYDGHNYLTNGYWAIKDEAV